MINKQRLMLALCFLFADAARSQTLDYQTLEGMFDEPVTTSATGKPERLSDTAATMDIITLDDIRRSGARDLATLLRLLPGIANYRGDNGSEPFSVAAILLNGREIYFGAFGQMLLESLPVELEEIRQIEVLQGPQSALYGFNSSDGVINIITFDPARDGTDWARLRGGDEARRDGAASVTFNPMDGVGVRLTAGADHLHENGFIIPAGLSLPTANQDRRSFSANASAYSPDDSGHATFEVAHSDTTLRTLIPQTTLPLDVRLLDDAVKGDYTIDTAAGRIGGFVSYTSLSVPEAHSYSNGPIDLHDHTVDGRLNDLVKLSPDDSVRIEFEARNETMHSTSASAPMTTLMLAESVMWNHRFSDTLSMVNAVRYYHGEIRQDELTSGDLQYQPHGVADNSAIIYKFDADDSLRGSFARGLALPSELSVSQLGISSTRNLPVNNLATWTNTEARITYDHMFRDVGIMVRGSLFDQLTGDLISLTPLQLLSAASPVCNPPTPKTASVCQELTAASNLSGTAQGIELELEHKSTTGLTWGANYTLEQIHPHGWPGSSMLATTGISDIKTTWKANAHVGYGWDAWNADIRLLYTSPTTSLMLDTLNAAPKIAVESDRSVVTLSPRLGWQVADHASVELSAENLWPYRVNTLEKADSLYYLTLRISY